MEDRHLDGRACIAAASGVVSLLLVFVNPPSAIFFGAWAGILGGASVIGVDDPASRRTRRLALLAVLLALPSFVVLVLLGLYGFTAPPRD